MLKKKTILMILLVVILITAGLFAPRLAAYFKWQQTAKAAGAMPWQDGGIITKVSECILDSACAPACTLCGISCPQVSSVYGTACVGYVEITTQSQYGTTFLAPAKGFIYKGGGSYPVAGMQYIAGGASNIMPWIIGIPSQ